MASNSPKFSLNLKDALEGLLVAALSGPIFILLSTLSQHQFNINWTALWQMAVSSGAGFLIKNYFSGPNPPTSGSGPAGINAKVLLLVVLSGLLGTAAKSQSIFKPYPKPRFNASRFSHAVIVMDSTATAVRPVAIAAAYGYEPGGLSFLMAGTGIGLKHLQWDEGTGKWSSQYSFNAVAWAQGQVAPSGAINPFSFAFGPTVGFLNDVIHIGFAWDFTKGKPMAIMVFSIPTNN